MSQSFIFEKRVGNQDQPIRSFTLSQSDFDANGTWETEFKDITNYNQVTVTTVIEEMTPDRSSNVGYEVAGAVIMEAEGVEYNGGSWGAYHSGGGRAPERDVLIGAHILDFNSGIDDIDFGPNGENSRLSLKTRQVGDKIKMRLQLVDRGNGGDPIQTLRVSITGVLDNV